MTEGRIYAEMFREAEAEKVADICARLIGNVMITRADKSFSPLRAGDIALLSPGHTGTSGVTNARWSSAILPYRRKPASRSCGGRRLRIFLRFYVCSPIPPTLWLSARSCGDRWSGLSDQELLDITAGLPADRRAAELLRRQDRSCSGQSSLSRKQSLSDLRDLRGRAAISTPSLILAEAIERLNARVIMAARHRNRNARALANLDALIERARGYGVAGLRAFVRDLQADWEGNERAPEGRIDAAEHAIEIVTIHRAKGLEWPVVIPINSTTELYRPDQFVHRQSDNTLHWMVGGVAPPDLATARAEESREDANQRERIWYVACTRARDLLILPHIPQAAKNSWFSSIDLRQGELPELDISSFACIGRPAGDSRTRTRKPSVSSRQSKKR